MKNETEETGTGETAGVERSFFVENADKGIYTCGNKEGKICEADLCFSFYEGGRRERIKKYDAVKISVGGVAKFTFSSLT